jgi:lipid-A-disaccharide synthase-like uncharacterized protein
LYLLFIFAYTKKIIRSLWITYISTLLFFQGRYFINYLTVSHQATPIVLPVYYGILFSDVILLALLFFIFRRNQISILQRRLQLFEYVFVLILIIGLISSIFSYFSNISFFYLLQISKYFILYFIAHGICTDKKIFKITIEIFLIYILFNSLLICIQKFHGGPFGLPIEHLNMWSTFGSYAVEQQDLYRPGGIYDEPNFMSSIIGIIFPIICYLCLSKNIFNRSLVWMALVFSIFALIIAGSRSVWIITVIIGIVGYYMYKKSFKHTKIRIPNILQNKLILIIVAGILMPFFINRILTIPTAFKSNGSALYRVKHISIAKDYMLAYPFGIGLYTFSLITPMKYDPHEYSYKIAEPHNIFAQIGSELGLVGLLLFCFLYFRIIRQKIIVVNRKHDPIYFGITLSCISYIGIACFYPWFIFTPIGDIFWIFMGLEYDNKNIT